MTWNTLALSWLARASLGGLIVLAAGSLAAALCRQPARRARLVVLTLLGAFLVPWLGTLQLTPTYSARVLPPAVAEATRPEPIQAASPPIALPARPPMAVAAASSELDEEPAAAAAPAPVLTWRLAPIAAYLAGASALAAWWLVGQLMLRRICRAAAPAPFDVALAFDEVSGGRSDHVRLLVSDRVDLPFTFTWLRPVILIPPAMCAPDESEALRYALAHEWSHVERHDAWAWNLASLAGLLLFYQPLFWWLRRQLRLCQDFLADDRAAAQGSAEDYAAYLVRLARSRARVAGSALPALGIGDRRSNLYRRVLMLVQDREPFERRCRTLWSLAAACLAALAMIAASGLRLDAAQPPEMTRPKDVPKDKDKAKDPDAPEVRTYSYKGHVKDKDTGKPIAGATVVVRRKIVTPNGRGDRDVQETKHTTDANGEYAFTIPPEQAAQKSLYIELDVEHPDYATQAGFGYSFTMIAKNERLGGRPFFETTELRPARPVTGKVTRPDGSPAKGVKVLSYSKTDKLAKGQYEYGSFATVKTGDDGAFRVPLTTPGQAVLWILPKDDAPQMYAVPSGRRGDLGTFALKAGVRLKGRVLDAEGKPVEGAYVNITRGGGPETEVLGPLRVADAINRTAVTGGDGTFEAAPLPDANYTVAPGNSPRDGDANDRREPRELKDVFLPQKVTIKEGETPEPLEIRAAPHVVFEARWIDSKGKPTFGFETHIFGQIDGNSWFGEAKPNKDGVVTAKVPHGMENVQFGLMTNEHHAIRWRIGKDGPLSSARDIRFPRTLDHDVKGVEIVHYNAPIVVVKAETKDHKPVKGLKVSAVYTKPDEAAKMEGSFILADGVNSDVTFEAQEDGRVRSSQLQPDMEFTLTVKADGYKDATRTLTLPEGKSQDVTLVLEPK